MTARALVVGRVLKRNASGAREITMIADMRMSEVVDHFRDRAARDGLDIRTDPGQGWVDIPGTEVLAVWKDSATDEQIAAKRKSDPRTILNTSNPLD